MQINDNYIRLLDELKEQNRRQFQMDLLLEKIGCGEQQKSNSGEE